MPGVRDASARGTWRAVRGGVVESAILPPTVGAATRTTLSRGDGLGAGLRGDVRRALQVCRRAQRKAGDRAIAPVTQQCVPRPAPPANCRAARTGIPSSTRAAPACRCCRAVRNRQAPCPTSRRTNRLGEWLPAPPRPRYCRWSSRATRSRRSGPGRPPAAQPASSAEMSTKWTFMRMRNMGIALHYRDGVRAGRDAP